ncbi:MAG: hypothetical protein MPJ53_05880, partial [Alphaproteobacteria bacterium]|nr:hypothetical protein [Alphaproteobacteria bacterium]
AVTVAVRDDNDKNGAFNVTVDNNDNGAFTVNNDDDGGVVVRVRVNGGAFTVSVNVRDGAVDAVRFARANFRIAAILSAD